MRVPKAGGETTTLVTEQNGLFDLAVGPEYVYWTNGLTGSVSAVPKDGGAPFLIATGQGVPYGIAVGPDAVYWSSYTYGRIMKAPLNGVPF